MYGGPSAPAHLMRTDLIAAELWRRFNFPVGSDGAEAGLELIKGGVKDEGTRLQ